MVTKKKGLIIATAIVVVIGIIYATRRMNGNNSNRGQHNLYHPIGGAYQQVANPTMQPDNDTASFTASSSGCGCNKKRNMI